MDPLTVYDIALSPNSISVYLNAQVPVLDIVCQNTIYVNGVGILTFQSNRFDVFEGKQCITIRLDQSVLSIHDAVLLVTLSDKYGGILHSYEKKLKSSDLNMVPDSSFIHFIGKVQYSSLSNSMNIMIGGICFKIVTNDPAILNLCRDYLTRSPADEYIKLSQSDIIYEKAEYIRNNGNFFLPDSEIESLALRRKISELLLNYDEFQIHGAAVAVKNTTVIFTADSGVGKTTHVSLWLEKASGAFIVNGDHPIIKTTPIVSVCGSPWCGKEGLNTNTIVPLKAIVIMERNDQKRNIIEKISFSEALPDLINQVHRPYDPGLMKKTLHLLSFLNGNVDFYRFSFDNFAEDAFSVSYNAIFS